jgi:hypothetical protein
MVNGDNRKLTEVCLISKGKHIHTYFNITHILYLISHRIGTFTIHFIHGSKECKKIHLKSPKFIFKTWVSQSVWWYLLYRITQTSEVWIILSEICWFLQPAYDPKTIGVKNKNLGNGLRKINSWFFIWFSGENQFFNFFLFQINFDAMLSIFVGIPSWYESLFDM